MIYKSQRFSFSHCFPICRSASAAQAQFLMKFRFFRDQRLFSDNVLPRCCMFGSLCSTEAIREVPVDFIILYARQSIGRQHTYHIHTVFDDCEDSL